MADEPQPEIDISSEDLNPRSRGGEIEIEIDPALPPAPADPHEALVLELPSAAQEPLTIDLGGPAEPPAVVLEVVVDQAHGRRSGELEIHIGGGTAPTEPIHVTREEVTARGATGGTRRSRPWPAIAAAVVAVAVGLGGVLAYVATRDDGGETSAGNEQLADAVNERDAEAVLESLGPGNPGVGAVAEAEALLAQLPSGSRLVLVSGPTVLRESGDTRIERAGYELRVEDGGTTSLVVERWFVRQDGGWIEVATVAGKQE